VAELPCWRFRHSGDPHSAALALNAWLAPQQVEVSA
jgi:hypothetical protein